MAEYIVTDGVTSSGVTLYKDDNMYVSSGGTAIDTTNTRGRVRVSSGGTAIGTTVSIGWLHVSAGGTAINTTVNSVGYMYVSSGASAAGTTVNFDGEMHVLFGGSAANTTVNYGCFFFVYPGATAANTTVKAGGSFFISSGGTATDTTLEGSGGMYIWSSGTASNTTLLSSRSWVHVLSDATAINTTVNPGCRLYLESGGATAIDTTLNFDGYLYVSSGGTATNTTVSGGVQNISSGGTAIDTTLIGNGCLYVFSGGTAANTTVDHECYLRVGSGGKVTGKMTFLNGADVYANDGAIVDFDLMQTAPGADALVNRLSVVLDKQFSYTLTVADLQADGTYKLAGDAAGFNKTITVMNPLGEALGTITVADGTKNIRNRQYTLSIDDSILSVTVTAIPDVTGNVKSVVYLSSGMIASGVNILKSGYLIVSSGALASNTTVNSGGVLTLFSSSTAKSTTVNSGGSMNIAGTATDTTVNSGGRFYVNRNGSADAVTVNSGGTMMISSCGTATRIMENGGYVEVLYEATATFVPNAISGLTLNSSVFTLHSGTTGTDTTVNSGGRIGVYSSGTATNTTLNSGGFIVFSGGTADVVTVNSGCYLNVSSGGTAMRVMENGGAVNDYSGATVTFVPNSFGGYVYSNSEHHATIHSGTTGTDLTFLDGFGLTVYDGGVAKNIRIASGFFLGLQVSSGGKLTGKVTIDKDAFAIAHDGAIVDFDLRETKAGADALVNNLSVFLGDESPNFTLTVDGTEADGVYKLAGNATGFDRTITVVNTAGMELGTLTVAEGEKTIGNHDYTLTLDGGILGVKISPLPVLTGNLNSSYALTSGKVANSVSILSSGCLYVSNGALANAVNVNSDGVLCVFVGGRASRTNVNSKGIFIVAGGVADVVTVNSSGSLTVSSGGVADVVTVNSSGSLTVSSGGKATQIMENGGCVEIANGASATFVPHEFSGFVYSDANASATVHSGTTATGTTVGALLKVYSGGIAKNTTLTSGGCLMVSSGALATGATVNSGGRIDVDKGGRLTGSLTFKAGATIHAGSGAILDFDITQTAPGKNALVNDLSPALAEPFSYTLTVSGTEAEGNYRLAEGATGFQKTITVVDTLGKQLGTLTVAGGKKRIGSQDYTLTLNGGVLAVKVGAVDLTGDLTSSFRITSGMVASSVNILDSGSLSIDKGGSAVDTTVTNGELTVSSGGKANLVTIISGGRATVYAGGSATGIVAEDGARLGVMVAPGAYAKGTYAGSAFEISSRVSGFAIHSGCELDVAAGGSASIIDVKSEGWLYVDGGNANDVTVSSGGRLAVYGGSATGIVAEDGAFLAFMVAPGSYAKGTYAGSAFEIDSRVSGYTIHSGQLAVFEGGKTEAVTVNIGGELDVFEGGSATQIRENGGAVLLEKGARYSFVSNTFTGVHVSGMNSATAHSGTTAIDTTVGIDGELAVFSGGVASGVTVASTGHLVVSSGGKLTGKMTFENGAIVSAKADAVLDFDLTQTPRGAVALVNDLSFLGDAAVRYTLTVGGSEADGSYKLAGGAAGFDKTITVVNSSGVELGTLTLAGGTQTIGGQDYKLNLGGDDVLSVTVGAVIPSGAAKSDVDGNGVSDVLFQYTGGFGQIGFWMNGTNEWRSTNTTHPVDTWDVLGAYDMNANGKADSVLVGNVEVGGVKGAFVGYYVDAEDTDDNWVNISYLTNNEGYAWKNKVGNLTGNAGVNSIVWHCAEIGALGAWTDGTDSWVGLGAGGYDANWTLVGCGDFDGDGKDAVLMSYASGVKYYTVGIDGVSSELTSSDTGWAVRAIGDFSGDGRDDIVAFHKDTGLVAMWGDGDSSASNWSQLGQLDANDWFVVGAGDYNGDAKDDLLVRQYSTGMLGYYTCGDMSQWNVLGYGVDMSWTVIA